MSDSIHHPYEQGGRWLKGNIHVHGIEASNGSTEGFDKTHGEPNEALYAASIRPPFNFDFVCISIHSYVSGIGLFGRAPNDARIVGIPAREIQNDRVHDGRYDGGYFRGEAARYLHVLTLGEEDGFSICCHPLFFECAKPSPGGEWRNIKEALLAPCDRLKALDVRGIEIYNGLTMLEDSRQGGSYAEHFAEACWDDLLQAGYRCFGFAGNDEFFRPSASYEAFSPLGYIVVCAESTSRDAILDAIKRGRFYSSTGVELGESPLRVEAGGGGATITVSAKEPVQWTAVVHEQKSGRWALNRYRAPAQRDWAFELHGHWKYARFQAQDPDDPLRRAWLQPIFAPDSAADP